MGEENKMPEQDKLLAELLLRISTIEKLLIDKGLISLDEYNEIFTKSVNKLFDLLKEDVTKNKIASDIFKN